MDIEIRRNEGISQAIKRQLIEYGANEAQFKNKSLWISIKEIISNKSAGDILKTRNGNKNLGEAFEKNTATNADDTVSITKETWNKLVTLTGARKSADANAETEQNQLAINDEKNDAALGETSPDGNEKYQNKAPANGKLDHIYKQGDVADCWILAGIESVKRKAGGKKYLESLITMDSTGNYFTVWLPGISHRYTFSQRELQNAAYLSKGDLDVRLFELAMDKYYKSINEGDRDEYGSNIGRDYTEEFYKAILPPVAFVKTTSTPQNPFNPKNFSNPRKAYTISVKSSDTPTVENGEHCGNKLHQKHAYSVVKSDSQYIYIIDPHASDRIMKLSVEEFKKYNVLIESVVLP